MFQKVQVVVDPDSLDNDCYRNCLFKVARDGGEVVVGWRRTPATNVRPLIASLDHHAVWRSPSGELIDISRRAAIDRGRLVTGIQDAEIDFEPDPTATFSATAMGRLSRYVPLVEDKFGLLARACELATAAVEHRAEGRIEKAEYAHRKAQQLLDQHRERLRYSAVRRG